MKSLIFNIGILTLFVFSSEDFIQGKWKIHENEAFLNILTSDAYFSGKDDQKTKLAETVQFALDSTFYHFKNDSVFFTDTGTDNIVKHKSGKWLMNSDTLLIFESGKFTTHRFLINKLTKEELKVHVIFSNDEISRSTMTFRKVK
jgi:hypothetical protein